MKRIMSVLLVVLLVFPVLGAIAENPAPKALTLMIYMTGSDLESDYSAATNDMEEMQLSNFNARQVNILIMTGGARYWETGQKTDDIQIGHIKGSQVVNEWTESAMNMGEAETLAFFLDYAVEKYPAEEYALILWDHGGGPMEGVCYDELNNMDALSLAELNTALAGSAFGPNNRLSWIGFDACLMASVETAGICADYARYMIASQETEPGTGWDYSFMSALGHSVSGEDIGRMIVDSYVDNDNDKLLLTLSCVNLDRIADVFAAMDAMFAALGDDLNAENFSELAIERQNAKSFGRTTTHSNYDLVDLYHLSMQYSEKAPAETAAVQKAVDTAVVYSQTNQKNAHGLSLYSPYYNKNGSTPVLMEMPFRRGRAHPV